MCVNSAKCVCEREPRPKNCARRLGSRLSGDVAHASQASPNGTAHASDARESSFESDFVRENAFISNT